MAAYTTIDDPEAYFQVQLYTGNGSANHAITLGGDTDMQPDLVWIKNRDAVDAHCLFDAVRGATKLLSSDANTAESTDTDTLDSFATDGFQVDADVKVNTNTEDYVAWCWKESATAGFDIVSWTGNGSAQDISHSLSKVPTFIIVKNRDQADSWYCYNVHNGNTHSMILDTDSAKVGAYTDNWNDTTPTTSVFSVGGSHATSGGSSEAMIAYAFTDIQGFSKFGKYTGNGGTSGVDTADGTFVYTGFRPAWVMIKRTDTANQWGIGDTKRDVDNPVQHHLFSESTQVEGGASSYNNFDILSNGFKLRSGDLWTNASGGTYIFMAFAEASFVNSNGVPCNAR